MGAVGGGGWDQRGGAHGEVPSQRSEGGGQQPDAERQRGGEAGRRRGAGATRARRPGKGAELAARHGAGREGVHGGEKSRRVLQRAAAGSQPVSGQLQPGSRCCARRRGAFRQLAAPPRCAVGHLLQQLEIPLQPLRHRRDSRAATRPPPPHPPPSPPPPAHETAPPAPHA
ncbi:hypothetical protein AMQ83_13775, partial [Paenibacillus riograndensis]